MPVYEYKCSCGRRFERFLPLAKYKDPQTCECGKVAEKLLSRPAVIGDYPGYECPITGQWIEGRRAHEENLKKHGCRILEPGESSAYKQRKEQENEAFLDSIAETAAVEVANMPAYKQEKLANELSHGVDVTFERK